MSARKHHSLNWSITRYCAVLFAVLAIAVGTFSYINQRNALYRECEDEMLDILNYVDAHIDHDDLARCVRTGKESEHYRELRAFVDDVYTTHSIGYLYIIWIKEVDGKLIEGNIITGLAPEDYDDGEGEIFYLNSTDFEYYTQEALAEFCQVQQRGELTYLYLPSSLGEDYTAVLPLKDSDGAVFGLLCLDKPTNGIHASLRRNLTDQLALLAVIGLVAVGISYAWMRRTVTDPIHRLCQSVTTFAETAHNPDSAGDVVFADPDIHTGNEVEGLSDAIAQMAVDLSSYALGLQMKQQQLEEKQVELEEKQQQLVTAEHAVSDKEYEVLEKEREMQLMQTRLDKMGMVAYQDPLTHVKNKTAYQAAWMRLQRGIVGHAARFALVMVDVNHLKAINDTYGHERGDEYIVGTCRQVCVVFTHSPVYRIGGDEFVVILEGEDYNRREELVEELVTRLSESSHNMEKRPWERFSAAVGMAAYELGDFTVDNVFSRADKLMYADKLRQKAERRD